jgi:diaminopimelate epimerase
MNGAGNEIVVLDLRGADVAASGEDARAISQKPGLAFDQLMVIRDPKTAGTNAFVTIFNNDGSESGACGNGARCVAYRMMSGVGGSTLQIETSAGVLECRRESEFVFCVDMGPPRLGWRDIPLRGPVDDTKVVPLPPIDGAPPELNSFSAVNMGNPHAVFWVSNAADYDPAVAGPVLETHPIFPEKANISFAEIVSRNHIRLRVWERGAGATKACGSAACAALVAAARAAFTERKARISLPGGDLLIEWREGDAHVLMTGPVEMEFETTLDATIQGAPA